MNSHTITHSNKQPPSEPGAEPKADFFMRCQFCSSLEPLKRVGVQRACERCHRAVLAYFDAIVQGQVRDDFAEQGGEDAILV